VAGRVREAIEAIQPDVIYHPGLDEVHPDHHALARAVEEALRAGGVRPAHYAYEIWATVRPTHIIDIGSVWERKWRAMAQFQSQTRYNDHLHKISGLNAYRAIYLPSARYVEAFQAG